MIEVGESVRSRIGSIGKVTKIEENKFLYENKTLITWIGNVVKHSKNIIDLIEVGDLVNGMIVFDIITYDNGEKAIKISSGYLMSENEIQDILTHEQYQANCYTVERNEE